MPGIRITANLSRKLHEDIINVLEREPLGKTINSRILMSDADIYLHGPVEADLFEPNYSPKDIPADELYVFQHRLNAKAEKVIEHWQSTTIGLKANFLANLLNEVISIKAKDSSFFFHRKIELGDIRPIESVQSIAIKEPQNELSVDLEAGGITVESVSAEEYKEAVEEQELSAVVEDSFELFKIEI